jgi:hypothetical protein
MQKIFFFYAVLLLILPIPAFADDDSGDSAELLGWAAIGCGVIANIPFIAINKYRKYAVRAGGTSLQMARQIGTNFKSILNFHIMLNSIGYFAGMSHGFILAKHLDATSLSLAMVMTVMMASGLMLRYTSSRHTKIFNRLLHGQFGLVLLLAALVVLHVASGDD